MNELIRRKDALNALNLVNAPFLPMNTNEHIAYVYALKNLPSVDAVEVLRCKDCKYFDGECCDRYADETLGYLHSTQPNFFCAVGERRTDDS